MKRKLIGLWLFIAAIACLALGFWIGDVYQKARREGEIKARITLLEKNQKEHLRILTRHTDLLEAMGYRFEALEKDRRYVISDTFFTDLLYAPWTDEYKQMEIVPRIPFQ